MEKPRVYIETTIPSAYFDDRRDPAMVARREATRRWWATAGERYELVTSAVVRRELLHGPVHRREDWLKLITRVRLLSRTPAVKEAARTYIRHKLMPSRPVADAHHLAFASYFGCEYLLTWDLKHLANPNKIWHIRRINQLLGLDVPRIVAPTVLLEEEYGSG